MDKTTFWWAGLCGICHPGGGPTELDRDGQLLYDEILGQYGYEKLGKTQADVQLDGDYTEINHMTGEKRMAPWHQTGVAEADCLFCHRTDRVVSDGKNMNWIWRTATLRAKDKLVDEAGDPVRAFAAASTAGQGWFRAMEMAATPAGTPPMATRMQVDYAKGLADGSLGADAQGGLWFMGDRLERTPKDLACWGCHVTPEMKKRGRAWFDPEKDVHYAYFNNLDDADPDNDIGVGGSSACTQCHPAGIDHNIAKGNATLGSVFNHTDYAGFRTCRDCHDPASPERHPDAMPLPDTIEHSARHLRMLSCEACHIPYKTDPADLAIDNATTGSTVGYPTSAFLSSDPLDPAGPDDSRWYPSFVRKRDQDGQWRIFPVKLLLSSWWGDWDTRGTATKSDDVVNPIALWRLRSLTAGQPLPGTTDDNGDGKPEVNRHEEIALYIAAIKAATDRYGTPLAANPVLVKGGRIWFEDPAAPHGVGEFEYHGTGIQAESSHPFSINHNVRPTSVAVGAAGCTDCHRSFGALPAAPFFDRLILVDPFGPDGLPVYKTVRELTGYDPP